jgi:hypothetical protein
MMPAIRKSFRGPSSSRTGVVSVTYVPSLSPPDSSTTRHLPGPQWARRAARIDVPADPRTPAPRRLAVATVVSIAGSLLLDALLVVIGEVAFPSTKGYVHFRFSDYGKLTVIGVVLACVAWPVVTRLSSSARWLFARLAVLVTLVLLLPDVLILSKGQPAEAVVILMGMHLAIALVTYYALVSIAPPRPR